jgi:dolichol-phosphate mannosyltransferase/undecaprenyl-phosphate 4-deoxy-4-formamido-L-arabinose transferase
MSVISIVIPVYKSTKSLEIISKQVFDLQQQSNLIYELIFVNDSPGFLDTAKTLEKILFNYPDTRVISLRKNQGQHLAILVGINHAKGDFIITMDDDLQHPVNEIPKLIKVITENPQIDAVFAVPSYSNKKHSLWRNVGSCILNKIDTLFLEKPKGLIKSPFRIMTADLSKVVVNSYNATPALSSLIIKATNNIINIEVKHNERLYGNSHYSLRKLISLSLNNVLHYSSLPLNIVGNIGFAGLTLSLFFILWTVIRKLFFGITFPGYASTVILISFFGGLNLFAIGLVGEYLIRIIKEQHKVSLDDLIKDIK